MEYRYKEFASHRHRPQKMTLKNSRKWRNDGLYRECQPCDATSTYRHTPSQKSSRPSQKSSYRQSD